MTTDRIYLTGFMGSGKTSVGRALAEVLRVPFVDLDDAFEAMAGRTIRETFELHGEAWFRERESELLEGTASLPRAVIALGGGTFTRPENFSFISRCGVSVFLDVPFGLIAERLGEKSVDRPLFRSTEEAKALYEARQPYYRMASWTVPVRPGESVNEVVDRVLCVLQVDGRLESP